MSPPSPPGYAKREMSTAVHELHTLSVERAIEALESKRQKALGDDEARNRLTTIRPNELEKKGRPGIL